MDPETKQILTEQQLLSEVINHQGWSIVEKKFNEFTESLKNAFDLENKSATTMLKDLQARKYAYVLLQQWMNEIKGSSEVVLNNKPTLGKSFIVELD